MKTEFETELHIELIKIKKAALTLRAINHLLRQQMLRLIDNKKRITVTEIHTTFRIEQSVASQHLALLRKAGFVSTERNGKYIFYSINYDRIKEIHQVCNGLINS